VLRDALIADAGAEIGADVIDDAVAAAALMAMNNVYYRFRHLVAGCRISQMPARLRMQRIATADEQADFELFCLCGQRDQRMRDVHPLARGSRLPGGLSEEQVHDDSHRGDGERRGV
jgi:alkyl hydroperoxide reductase subunit D